MNNSTWQVLPRRALVRQFGTFGALLFALFFGITSGPAHALEQARASASVLGVFTRAAEVMDCDIAGMTWGTTSTSPWAESYCYTGTSVTTYANVADRALHVVDHYPTCAPTTVASDTGWTTQRIDIPPELHEYSTYVQGGDRPEGRQEYRLVKVDTPYKNSNGQCGSGSFRYVLGNALVCAQGKVWSPAQNSCILGEVVRGDVPEPICRKSDGETQGNPILPASQEKYRFELDIADAGSDSLSFGRTYRSSWGNTTGRATGPMGKAWTHNHSTSLQATGSAVAITSAEGYVRRFSQATASSPWLAANSADTLSQVAGIWIYRRSDDDSTLRFDAAGRLLSTAARNAWTTNYAYNAAGQLASITNALGRTLTLVYNSSGQLVSVSAPGARTVNYSYDTSGRLWLVTYPDGKTRTFAYESASFPNALTGILDETGARWGTFAYDVQGRAVSTELAGAADRYQVSYPAIGSASVIDPLGTTRNYSYATQQGRLAVIGGSLPSGTGEADAASRVQDANGLITRETDFKGVVTTTTWDVARRLPTSVTRAFGTPEAQIVTTVWHPTFSLPTLITEMGRTTSFTYDTLGNVLAQTVTDTVTSKSLTWQWTYNPQGLVASQTGSNGAVTTYSYDTAGNLTKARNALGQETSYLYDNANRVISSTSPNGLITTYAWDARDRLLSQVTGSMQATVFGYAPTGTLTTLALPSGVSFSYTYDAAHRPIGWSNNRGESGTFTLDAMGNRVSEQVRNAAGAVAWNAVRSVNSLNRLASRTEGPNQTSTFGYDSNGERIAETNGLNQSTRLGLDGLRRVTSLTDATNATATLAYNPLDDLTQVKDFKGVSTLYARNAQGNATVETSPDVGARTTEYDNLGLPSKIVDALGQATTIARDPLGRPTSLTFADGKVTTLAYDLTPYSRGLLSRIVDRSGLTDLARDAFGRVINKRVVFSTGLVQQILYTYKTAGGQLERIVYPEGSVLEHVYDSTGRLTTIYFNGQPLVTNITWNPMGQATGWTWAFVPVGLAASRSFDTAARMTQSEFATYVYDAAGRITSLTQQLFVPGDTNPANSSTALAPTTWDVGYSPTGRITSFNATGNTASFAYDSNGNRTSSVRTINGQTTSKTYAVQPTSNRIIGFNQTLGATSTSVTYGFNANGDMTSDGLRSFAYNAEGRLSDVTTGATDTSPTTRYAHNALGQRVFKTEPLYPPAQGDENDPGFMQSLVGFFTKLLWAPTTPDAEKLGFAYSYDEEGSLIFERGTGGPNSTGTTIYINLPTASGPMPIAAVINGQKFAVHSDHLNTPRRITNSQGQPVWQWAYSAFGDNAPTIAKNRFADLSITPNPGTTSIAALVYNLRYWGHYYDKESGLHHNWRRSYRAADGTYTQNDPSGLAGGLNPRIFVSGNPLGAGDPTGLTSCRMIGPVMQCDWGPPPMMDPENPYRPGAPASPGLSLPPYTLPGVLASACKALSQWMLSNDSVDLTGDRRRHILDGDKTGGGHGAGRNKPGKSEFPSGWSDDQAIDAISDVATHPDSNRRPGNWGRTVTNGTRNGLDIEVIVDPGGKIITGYPTNVPRNPK